MSLRQSLTMSDGNFSIFFTRPISAVGIMIALVLVISPLLPWVGRKKRVAIGE